MHRNTGIDVEDAYKAIDTYLKQTRKDERNQNRVSFLSIFPFFPTFFTLAVSNISRRTSGATAPSRCTGWRTWTP